MRHYTEDDLFDIVAVTSEEAADARLSAAWAAGEAIQFDD